ncbi:MAG: GreA/GreB family elongation factor [bacterium]
MVDPASVFRQHLGRREFELLEGDWLELLGSSLPPTDLLDLVELAVRYAPAGTAVDLLRVLAEWLGEKGEWCWQLAALRRLLELGGDEPGLAELIANCYRRLHAGDEMIERLLQRSGLGYGGETRRAFDAIENLVKLLPGRVLLDPECGPVRVTRTDLLLDRSTVRTTDGRELVLDLNAAASRLRPVEPGGLYELLITDPTRLGAAVRDAPGRFVQSLLRDRRRPMSAREIRAELADVITDSEWDGFWGRARRELDGAPHVMTVDRPARGYQWSDVPVEQAESRPRKSPARGAPVSEEGLASASRADALAMYTARARLTDRRQFVSLAVESGRPDLPELLSDLFCAERDSRARDFIEGQLRQLSPGSWTRLVARVLTSYRQLPAAFAWVAANSARLEGVEPSAVLTRTLDLLESPDHKAQFATLLRALFADDYRLVRASLDASEPAGARRLLDRLGRIAGVEDYRRQELAALVQARHPVLGDSPDDGVMLTTAAGLARARGELKRLTGEEMPRVADELGRARAQGDLSENYEYKAAKEKQARLAARVGRLQAELGRARVVRPDEVERDRVSFGCRVDVEDNTGAVTGYSVLGPWDSDPDRGVISYLAPLGRAMLGRRAGESFELDGRIHTIVGIAPAGFD